jgi:prepilin-type N-terminal cleavage/methylation domain-containing protein/prepilin-type processing-associated H-X9-DG protein
MASNQWDITLSICRAPRRAFTLIEAIVVIAIVGLLLAVLAPAIQSAREAARRANCNSNLRQLGIALNSYVAAVGSLPLMNNGRRGFSVHSMVLPYIDQTALFNSINFKTWYNDSANQTAASTKVAVLICPSDDGQSRLGAWTNYACNVGYGYQVSGKLNGVFVKRPDHTSLADIADGTTTTAMMAEWVVSPQTATVKDPLGSIFWTPQRLVTPPEFDLFVTTCEQLDVQSVTRIKNTKGLHWHHSTHGRTLYTHDVMINGYTCTNAGMVFEGAWTAASRHGSGACVLFADGHVQFVHDTVSLSLWRALGTRSGGELVSGQEF